MSSLPQSTCYHYLPYHHGQLAAILCETQCPSAPDVSSMKSSEFLISFSLVTYPRIIKNSTKRLSTTTLRQTNNELKNDKRIEDWEKKGCLLYIQKTINIIKFRKLLISLQTNAWLNLFITNSIPFYIHVHVSVSVHKRKQAYILQQVYSTIPIYVL